MYSTLIQFARPWRLRTLPSQGSEPSVLLLRPGVLALQVEVAHRFGHQGPVLEGQRLPKVMAVLVVLGDEYPASRATTQPTQQVLQRPLEARQREYPLLMLIVPWNR